MPFTIDPLGVLALRCWLEGEGKGENVGKTQGAASQQRDHDAAMKGNVLWVNRAENLGLFTDELEVDADEQVSVAEDGSGAWVRAWV